VVKTELVQRVAMHNPHLYQSDIENIVNAVFNELTAAPAGGDRVELRGFGAFSLRHRSARIARNPRTGAHVLGRQEIRAVFKTGKEMHQRLNQPEAEGSTSG
jgi:integration host factor subunit beta